MNDTLDNKISFGIYNLKINKRNVLKRIIDNNNKNIHYMHEKMTDTVKTRLLGMSGTAYDLFNEIKSIIQKKDYNDPKKYIITLDKEFKEEYIKYLAKNNITLSIRTLEKVIAELKKHNIISNTQYRGKYLFNFKEYGHIGNSNQLNEDIDNETNII